MWKMALALIPSAYVVSTLAVLFARAVLDSWPFLVVQFLITTLLCFVLTYTGLPITTRLLYHWLSLCEWLNSGPVSERHRRGGPHVLLPQPRWPANQRRAC